MKVLIFTAMLSLALSASSEWTPKELYEWELYKIKYMKDYSSEAEEVNRRNIFLNNVNTVRQHNLKYETGEVSYSQGINAFSDKTLEEMKTTMLNHRQKSNGLRQGNTSYEYTYQDVPKSLDWRKKGAVTPVKQQGFCRSCWAFAAVGSLEGMTFIKTGKLVPLSVQNLVDCDKLSLGCEGGWEANAYTYISKNGGIDTEASYPYDAKNGKCKFNPTNVGATVIGHTVIPKGDEDQMKQVVATKGPITVNVATNYHFWTYRNGVFHDCEEGTTDLDHAIVVVGYGTTVKGEDYWLIKNCWSEGWGMGGYMMLARGKNMCGVAEEAVFPLV